MPPEQRPHEASVGHGCPGASRFVYAASTAPQPRSPPRLLTNADEQRSTNAEGGSRISPETASDLLLHL